MTQLYSTERNHDVRVKVRIPREDPVAPTIHDLYPAPTGTSARRWRCSASGSRDTRSSVKLLLSEPFEGPRCARTSAHVREAKPWPGAVEGEEDEDE